MRSTRRTPCFEENAGVRGDVSEASRPVWVVRCPRHDLQPRALQHPAPLRGSACTSIETTRRCALGSTTGCSSLGADKIVGDLRRGVGPATSPARLSLRAAQRSSSKRERRRAVAQPRVRSGARALRRRPRSPGPPLYHLPLHLLVHPARSTPQATAACRHRLGEAQEPGTTGVLQAVLTCLPRTPTTATPPCQ